MCGDQHLAVVVKHGIDAPQDGPYSFTSPALVNTIYGRWWHPLDEKAGTNPVLDSPLPWTGDYLDGLGNPIQMLAYANPVDENDELQRGDGFGVVRFNKQTRDVTFECWPRFSKVADGEKAQYPGWPITINSRDNDGRKITGYLPGFVVTGANKRPVVQVIDEATGEIWYTVRMADFRFSPPIYGDGPCTIRIGRENPVEIEMKHLIPTANPTDKTIEIDFNRE